MQTDKRNNGARQLPSFVHTAMLMVLFEVSIKVIGFIKQSVIAFYFGGNGTMDAFFLSSDFINGFSNALIASIRIAIISTFTTVRHKKNVCYANAILRQVEELTIGVAIVLSILFILLSSWFGRFLAPSYATDELNVVANYLTTLSGVLVLSTICMIYDSVLNSYERYAVTKLRSLIYSASIIIACIFGARFYGNSVLIVAQYASLILYIIIQKFSVKDSYKFKLTPLSQGQEIGALLSKAGPLLIGNSMVYINYQVDNSIVSTIGEGGVSALAYAHTLDDFFVGVFITTIATMLFPHMANLIAQGNEGEGVRILRISTICMCMALVPIAVCTVVLSKDLVALVFSRGRFDKGLELFTAAALEGYAIRYPLICVRDFAAQGLYAYGDTYRPMRNAVIAMIINIMFSVTMSHSLGVFGVSFATTVSVLLSAVLNVLSMRKYQSKGMFAHCGSTAVRCVVLCAIALGIAILGARVLVYSPPLIRMICISVLVFALYYGGLAYSRDKYLMLAMHTCLKRIGILHQA